MSGVLDNPNLSNPAAIYTGDTGALDFARFNQQQRQDAGRAQQIVGSVALWATISRFISPAIIGTVGAIATVTGVTTWYVLKDGERFVEAETDRLMQNVQLEPANNAIGPPEVLTAEQATAEQATAEQATEGVRTATKTQVKKKNLSLFACIPLLIVPFIIFRCRRKRR